MYNGIGLSTVRGTATSGYVQRNRGHVYANRRRRVIEHHHQPPPQRDGDCGRTLVVSAAARERGTVELQQHEAKRQMENNLLVLREELEEKGLPDEDVEAQIEQARQRAWKEWEARNRKEQQQQEEEEKEEGQVEEAAEVPKLAGAAAPPISRRRSFRSRERLAESDDRLEYEDEREEYEDRLSLSSESLPVELLLLLLLL